MTPKKKAEELVNQHLNGVRNKYQKDYHIVTAKKAAQITINEIVGVLRYFIEENAYREDIKKSYWIEVRKEIDNLYTQSSE